MKRWLQLNAASPEWTHAEAFQRRRWGKWWSGIFPELKVRKPQPNSMGTHRKTNNNDDFLYCVSRPMKTVCPVALCWPKTIPLVARVCLKNNTTLQFRHLRTPHLHSQTPSYNRRVKPLGMRRVVAGKVGFQKYPLCLCVFAAPERSKEKEHNLKMQRGTWSTKSKENKKEKKTHLKHTTCSNKKQRKT